MHNIFFDNCIVDKNIITTRKYIKQEFALDENCSKFIKNLDNFIKNNKIVYTDSDFSALIIHNYWVTLLIYKKNKDVENPWSDDTLWNYLIVMTRILELSIFLYHLKDDSLIKLYFDVKDTKSFFEHFHSKENTINDEMFSIKKIIDNKKAPLHVFLSNISFYRSEINIVTQNKTGEILPWFEYYFKLNNNYMTLVHTVVESQNKIQGRNARGQKGEHIPFQTLNILEIKSFRNGNIKYTHENASEDAARANKIQSITYNKGYIKDFTNKDISKYNIASQHKQYQINHSIGASITTQNLNLDSNYYLPDIQKLQKFLAFIQKDVNNEFEKKIILLSLWLGISVEKLIYAIKNNDNNIKFISNNNKLTISFPKDIFAKIYNPPKEIAKQVNNSKNVEILLNSSIAKDWKSLANELKSEYDIGVVITRFTTVLNKYKKEFNKRININLKSLPTLLMRYFRVFHKESDIPLLLIGEISKADKARGCYVSQKKRLYKLESWINEFQTIILSKSITNSKDLKTNDDCIGSSMTVTPTGFKSFITSLLSIQSSDEIVNLNLNMIALRYILAIQISTRNFEHSCNLFDFSQRERILFLQEKNTNSDDSKRVIPLTQKCLENIEYFYHLKHKYKLNSYAPILLSQKENKTIEKVINKKNTLEFFDTLDQKIDSVKDIKVFVNKTALNFGRHVFSSIASFDETLNLSYLDAYLNHYKFGCLDQAIFSNFSNQDYLSQTTKCIQKIEDLYFPKYINFKGV